MPPAEDLAHEEWMARFRSLFWDLDEPEHEQSDEHEQYVHEPEVLAEQPTGPADEGRVWRAEVDRALAEWNGRLRAFFLLEEPSPGAARWLRSREAVFRDWNRRFRELFVWPAPSSSPEALDAPDEPSSSSAPPPAVLVLLQRPDEALRSWARSLRALFLLDPPRTAPILDHSPYLRTPSSYLSVLPDHQLDAKWHGRKRSRSLSRHYSRPIPRIAPTPPIRPPQMSVCIMIVGTRGDVQPFLAVAKRLQADGHRVRLATHALYRELVQGHGVEFFPLGGDPKALAAYMVKTGGRLIPTTLETLQKDVPRNMQMIDDILRSTWPAVSAPDPDGGGPGEPGEPFRADAIISNPVTYGHIHVAEKLGVPLHIMFPQPWVPTVAFPHPLANLPFQDRPQRRNYLSYKLVDLLMWEGTERLVNRFRVDELGLPRVRKGDGGRDLLLDRRVPHAFMWSPALVPKPADWGDLYDVVGSIPAQPAGQEVVYEPTPELEAFLGDDSGPIFVGFGSMVLQDPAATTRMIIEAAERANVRVLIQSSWSDMAAGITVPDSVFFIGECPHAWLLPRVAAVVHHGGAGTTAGGLLSGKPTFIVPFFGDQPFWGRAVVTVGVGVEPCPIAELTTERLGEAFTLLLQPEMRERAEHLQNRMRQEDGIEGCVQSFYRHLPVERMLCDVCRDRIPSKWSVHDRSKLCEGCSASMEARPENYWKRVVEYRCVNYRSRRGSRSRETDGALHYQPHALPADYQSPSQLLAQEVDGAVAVINEVGGAVKDVGHFLVLSCFSSWDVVAVV